jgi:hypothetical protein
LLGSTLNDLVTTAPAPLLEAQLSDAAVLPSTPAANMVGFLIFNLQISVSSTTITYTKEKL